ncbi:MAG: beta-glucoside-specific PTS transporter subunit IIABC [Hespellia sp.]|nr:beta-glucoside-specific PTS transporter subunit IIABC [Hespellia sp.]
MKKYDDLAAFIVKNVGGKENIEGLTHCMTRLRFKLKEENCVQDDVLKSNKEIFTVNHAGGKVQVVVGNKVDEVFDSVMDLIGGNASAKAEEAEKMSLLNRFIDVITKTITPILGLLCASGLIKGLLAILGVFHILDAGSGTYIILNALGDACFYFMPIVLGYTSAETFGLNKFVGMILGGLLIYPNIITDLGGGEVLYTFFKGTPLQLDAASSFLGIPVLFPQNGYSSTIVPIILLTWFAAKVEKWIKKWMPSALGFAFTPFLTMLICGPLGILVIGPITDILSNCISWATTSLYGFSPIITTFIVALVYQPLVIVGLHWPLLTLGIQNLAVSGFDYIWPMLFTASFAQTAIVIAVMIRTKNKTIKASAVPAIVSGCMCIIEPAIYGFTLPVKKRFGISCISAAIGAVIMTAFHCTVYGFGVGIFEFPLYIKPDGSINGMIMTITAAIVTMVIAFTLTWITYRETDDARETEMESKAQFIGSPVQGRTVELSSISDETFQSEVLGKTLAFYPEIGTLAAPCNGTIETVFPTGHAIGLAGEDGTEILLHIGIDTVQMNGKGFDCKVNVGDTVRKGDLLVEFDIDEIVRQGLSPEVIMVFTNTNDFDTLESADNRKIALLENLNFS